VTQTVIRYRAGQEAEALLLAKRVHGAALVEEHGVQTRFSHLILLVGSDYGTTTTIGSTTSPQPASSFAPRTATQNICT